MYAYSYVITYCFFVSKKQFKRTRCSFTPFFKGSTSIFLLRLDWLTMHYIFLFSSCGRSFFHIVGWFLYCCLAVLGLGSRVLVPLNISAALSSECACPFACFILPSLLLADGLNIGPWPIGCLASHLLMYGFSFCPLYIAAIYRFAGLMPPVFSSPFPK